MKNMEILRISIICLLGLFQFYYGFKALILILVKDKLTNIQLIGFGYLTVAFLLSLLLSFAIIISSLIRIKEFEKKENICPQYEMLEDPVYRLK